jgi:hypothetical protein
MMGRNQSRLGVHDVRGYRGQDVGQRGFTRSHYGCHSSGRELRQQDSRWNQQRAALNCERPGAAPGVLACQREASCDAPGSRATRVELDPAAPPEAWTG